MFVVYICPVFCFLLINFVRQCRTCIWYNLSSLSSLSLVSWSPSKHHHYLCHSPSWVHVILDLVTHLVQPRSSVSIGVWWDHLLLWPQQKATVFLIPEHISSTYFSSVAERSVALWVCFQFVADSVWAYSNLTKLILWLFSFCGKKTGLEECLGHTDLWNCKVRTCWVWLWV